MSELSAKGKTPAIRFKGFSGKWEEKDLGNNAEFSKGQGYSKSDLVESGCPIILYGRLYTNYETTISQVDTYALVNEKSILSKGSEVVVPASGETAEDIARASAVVSNGIILGGDLNIIYPNSKIASIFLALYISNGRTQKELSKKAQGKSVVHVRNDDLKQLSIYFPKEKEQTQIGNFFQQLDRLIAQHQQKHDKLRCVKKALLTKMFPKQGETQPAIRFKGFSAAWEEGQVGELLSERNTQAPKNKKYPLLAFVADKGVVHKGDRYNREFLVTDEEGKKYKQTEYGDFIYSSNNLETGSIGLNQYGSASISPVYSIFQITKLANSDFIGRMLIRKVFINKMIKWRQGVIYGQWRIPESNFLTIEINYPSLQEQTKIGKLFQQLDTLINQQQSQLTKLNNIKQAMLAKMFV